MGALLVLTTLASVATLVVTIAQGRAREARIEALEAEVHDLRDSQPEGAPATAGSIDGPAAPPQVALSATDLKAIADLCAVAVSSTAPAVVAEEEAPPDPEVAAERARARVDADTLFDGVADRGHWTEADRSALHELLGRLSREDGEEVTLRLARMLNDGEIELDTSAPL
jgi:hypothetical protein